MVMVMDINFFACVMHGACSGGGMIYGGGVIFQVLRVVQKF